jgi:predicted TIM-barrel fold metal-dependent hydrolase
MSQRAIDALTFLGQSLFGEQQSAEDLLRKLDSADIEQAVVCPFKPRGYHLGAANDLVAEAAARHPRFVGLARVDPNLGEEALLELDRCVRVLGLRGLFLHPWEECFRINAPSLDPLLAECASLQLPLVIATGYPWVSEAAQVGDLARRFPDVSIVMTHGGQINISGLGQFDALEVLRRHPNVCIETSGVYRQDFLEDVARDVGSERVLFGSNSPKMDVRLEIERVRWAAVSEAARAQMLAGNARRVFRLSSSAPRS